MEKKIACVVPWNSPFVWAKAMPGFLNIVVPGGVKIKWFFVNGWCSARRKTGGVEQALLWGAEYIWFVDADQVCEEDTLVKLWEHVESGRCPVGAMQPSRGYFKGLVEKPYQPVCWDVNGKPFTPAETQKVIYASLNCFLISTWIFKKLRRPWFKERYNEETMARLSSIDQHFTKKLYDNGFPMWIDPNIRPKHLDAVALDWTFQDRF